MNRSAIWALALSGLLALWMLSGDKNAHQTLKTAPIANKKMQVVVIPSKAQIIDQVLIANGQAKPYQETTLKAEIIAVVDKILVKEGASVKKGQELIAFKLSDKMARLKEAETKVTDEQTTLDAMTNLHPHGFSAKTKYFETKAELAKAKAKLLGMKIELSKTKIVAPFDGIISEISIEPNDYLKAADKVGYIINNSPLIIDVGIPQKNISQLQVANSAMIKLATGHTLLGQVTFISPIADPNTRMFKVEITAPNSQNLRSGVSAEALIATNKIKAHFISPALLNINMNGTMGIKIVDEHSKVQFMPANIARADSKGLWLSDLPDTLNIISVGQGFVEKGESVTFVTQGSTHAKNH